MKRLIYTIIILGCAVSASALTTLEETTNPAYHGNSSTIQGDDVRRTMEKNAEKANDNFDELATTKETKAVVQASAPADTTVDWYDTDQESGVLILKRHNGTTWVRASSHGVQYTASCATITGGMCVDTDDGKLYYHNGTAVVEVGTGGTFDQAGNYTLTGSWDFTGAIVTGVSSTATVASADTLGGIKVGSRLTITDGVLSADVQSGNVPTGTENQIPVYGATGILEAKTPYAIGDTSSVDVSTSGGTILFSVIPTYIQRRVSGTCSEGSSIRTIYEDGTVACESYDNGSATTSIATAVTTAPYSDVACTGAKYDTVANRFYPCIGGFHTAYVSGTAYTNTSPVIPVGVSDTFSSDCSTTGCTAYTAINGGITVSGGTAGGATSWAYNYVYNNTSLQSPNQDVTETGTYDGASDSTGLVFRVTPGATPTGYLVAIISGKVSLYSFAGNTRTYITSSSYASIAAGSHTVRVVANGTSIVVYVDGTSLLSTTSSTYTTGNYCGVVFARGGSNVDVRIDSFSGVAL